MTTTLGTRWLTLATARRSAWAVAVIPLIAAVAVIGGWGHGERDRLATDQLPRGYDSTQAAALAEQLPQTGTSTAIVVFSADTPPLTPAETETITSSVLPAIGALSILMPSEDGSAGLGIVTLDATSATDVSAAVTEIRAKLAELTPPSVTAQVTGPAGIEADLAGVFEGANFKLLGVTALVVAILLIVTYRSPILWIIPLAVVGIADQAAATLATRVLAAVDIAWNESTVGILSVLVFGAGTNYALLLISRYRDELRLHEDPREAMRVATRRTTEPVLASAGTVVAGVLTLLLSLIPTTRGLGLACAVGIAVAAAFVLGVLPSALVMFPRSIFWPRVPRVGDPTAAQVRSLWRRIGDLVSARPLAVALVVIASLGVLVIGNSGIRLGLDTSEKFLVTPESIVAAERIAESFPAGTANPTTVVTRADAKAVTDAAMAVPGVASVMPGTQGDGITSLQVVLTSTEGSDEARTSIVELREALAPFDQTYVGGPEAQTMDGTDAAARDRALVIPLILVVVLIALMALLRSILAPTILVLTVVGTYFAALGAGWWIFTGPLGYSAFDEGVPLLAFLFLVALGVDYNIFLVTRAREEARQHGTREGMLRALGATGGVITSAGILLAAVFATLGVLPLVVLAQLGLIVCLGVLFDTLVVRTLLVPSLALLLGERFWWPQRVALTHAATAAPAPTQNSR